MNITVHFDAQHGFWDGVLVDGKPIALAPSVDVQVNSSPIPFPSRGEWRLQAVRQDGQVIEAVRTAGRWELRQRFRVRGARIERDVTIRWNGAESVRVAGVYLRTPVLRLSPSSGDFWLIPGNFPIWKKRFADLKPGAVTEETGWTRGEYGIAVVHSAQAKLSLVAGYIFRYDQARVGVEEHPQGIALRHGFDTLLRLEPGKEFSVGTQVFQVVTGDEQSLLQMLARFADSLQNGPPAEQPVHLSKATLYELHPWGRLESWWAGDRGNRFSRLTAQLPFLRELGVTMLWLLPPGHSPPWVYTTRGFNLVAPENGSPQELKELIAKAHRLGMKVLVDLVVYGVHPESEEVRRLPESVWCVDEAGNRQVVWGGTVLSADVSHPAWQERMREVVTRWAKDYGFDGARLDVAGWGQCANWRNPLRANASVAYGGLQLNKVVRDAFRTVNRDAVILPEAGKPLAFRHADMLFDYPCYMAMRDITTQPDLAGWVRDMQKWLEWERHCYPSRALKGLVRFLENHDTVAAAQFFGAGPSQALMAICALMQGTPLIYQEQEIGFFDHLKAWLNLRQREQCFTEGDAQYTAVRASHPHVFTFLRRARDGAAVVAVNLTGEPVECELQWGAGLSRQYPVCLHTLHGEVVRSGQGGARVRIPPYRPLVLLLKRTRTSVFSLPASKPAPSARWRRLEDGTFRVQNAEQWVVLTPEGNLEDAFRHYHTRVKPGESLADALPVLKRAWSPVDEALLDGGEVGIIGMRWADGSMWGLHIETARTREASVRDARLDGKQVEVKVVPADACRVVSALPDFVPALHRRNEVEVQVTPLFVILRNRHCTLALSRRHGGVPARWALADGADMLLWGSDAYTDWGLVEGGYASADGETNPRLKVVTHGEEVEVSFSGWLRHRSWNGVQTCAVASPGTRYRLSYRLGAEDGMRIRMGVTPLSDRGQTRAFFALRLPVHRFAGWRRGSDGGKSGERTGVRLGEGGESAPPLGVMTQGGMVTISDVRGVQNSFLIDSGNGEAVLFLALLDGNPVTLRANEERVGEVRIALTPR